MLVKRFEENPIIIPDAVKPSRNDYEVVGAFNPGAIKFNGEVILLLRVAERPKNKLTDEELAPIFDPPSGEVKNLRVKHTDPDLELVDSRVFRYKEKTYLTSISHLRIARSDDGRKFSIDECPAVFPENEYETFGLEDPRISQIGDEFYITYKSVSEHGICTSLLRTRNFEQFERKGVIFCPENLDVVIFPEKIKGRYYALTRPVTKHIGPLSIWLSSSET